MLDVPTDHIPEREFEQFIYDLAHYMGKWAPLYQRSKEDWMIFKERIINATILNFEAISLFMEKEIYKGFFKNKERKKLYDSVNTIVENGVAASWFIGREFGSQSDELKQAYKAKAMIFLEDIPDEALPDLHKAALIAYSTFADIMIRYYNSEYTAHPQQKRDHLLDTFRGIRDKAIIQCFMLGVQSNDKY